VDVTSARKINANRANARASTGPKTAHGRARAARNALRHGLSVPVYSDPLLSEEVDALARKIAGPDASAKIQKLARWIAEAEIDLRRVREVRHQLVNSAWRDPDYESEATSRKKIALLHRWPLDEPVPHELIKILISKPGGPFKLAMILSDKACQLRALDRYERRALSRRKFAIRAYDDSRP